MQVQLRIAPGSKSVYPGIVYTSDVSKGTIIERIGAVQEGGLLRTLMVRK